MMNKVFRQLFEDKFAIIAIFLFSVVANAETIVCEPTHGSKIKKIEAIRNSHDYEPQWLDTKISMGIFEKDDDLDLLPLYMKDKYVLLSFDNSLNDAKLVLEIPNAKGPGQYKNSKATYNKGRYGESTTSMECVISGDVPFVNYCTKSRYGTPIETLFHAARVGSGNLVDMVLSCEIDVNEYDQKQCTPLMVAVDPNCGTGVFEEYRGSNNTYRIIQSLAKAGAFVDLSDPVTEETPLIKAARNRETAVAKFLLESEADINAQDRDGYTAIMRAVEFWDKDAVEMMLKFNPDLELKNRSGESALMIAQKMGLREIELLLQPPKTKINFTGLDSGGCSASLLEITVNEVVELSIISTASQMFMLTINELGVNLMADAGSTKSVRIRPTTKGRFKFTCGTHGGSNNTQGTIIVK